MIKKRGKKSFQDRHDGRGPAGGGEGGENFSPSWPKSLLMVAERMTFKGLQTASEKHNLYNRMPVGKGGKKGKDAYSHLSQPDGIVYAVYRRCVH